jgi:hypothetical protein
LPQSPNSKLLSWRKESTDKLKGRRKHTKERKRGGIGEGRRGSQ